MLIVFVTALFHLFVPLAWCAALAFRRPSSRIGRLFTTLAATMYVGFLFTAGAGWAVLGGYTRWLVLLTGAALLLLSLRLLLAAPWFPTRKRSWPGIAAAALLAGLLATTVVELAGPSTPAVASALGAPLPAGRYWVVHGGANPVMNHHHGVSAQRYALDIVGMNRFGTRASSLAPRALGEFAIYDVGVLAPCAGEVVAVVDGVPDVAAGKMPTGASLERGPAGNMVAIHCDNVTVLLAHLRSGSTAVAIGDRVAKGVLVGRVGNSGNTSEPHLHIHAVRGKVSNVKSLVTDADGVPVLLASAFPERNDTLRFEAARPNSNSLARR